MKPLAPRTVSVAAAGVIGLGAALRLIEFLERRPLWVDEAMVALNIGRRTFAGLASPLQYDQSAPLLFLWAVKAAALMGGMGEYALRFVPLVGGLLLTWLVWRLGKLIGGADTGLIAGGLAAMAVFPIYFAAELKPYGTDAAVTAAILLLALRVRLAPDRAARWWQLGMGGAAAFLLSTPSPFVAVSAAVALLADPAVRRNPAGRRRWTALCLGWAVCGGLIYWLLLLPTVHSEYLRRYWEGTFLDPGATNLPERLFRAGQALLRPLPAFLMPLRTRLCMVAILLGLGALSRRRGLASALMVGMPFLALGTAAALRLYPVDDRLLIFLAPCLYLCFAALALELLRLARLGEGYAGLVGLFLVLAFGARGVYAGAVRIEPEGGRGAANRILDRAGGEPVYILPAAIPEWVYYSTDWSQPDTVRLDRFAELAASGGPSAQNALVPVAPVEDSTMAFRGVRLELLGRRSGVRFREPATFIQDAPDPDWAGREADRISAVARPYVWMYGTHWYGKELPALRAELVRRGVTMVETMEEERGLALRLRFPVSRPGAGPP